MHTISINASSDEPVPAQRGRPDRLSHVLREMIMAGRFEPGARLPESELAGLMGVSRTPVRVALAALEQEGLVLREPNRGYRLRAFSIDEIVDAVKLRAELEAMAARQLAERGMLSETAEVFRANMRLAEELLSRAKIELKDRQAWSSLNRDFHQALINAAGNRPLAETYGHVCCIPLAAPHCIVFDQTADDFGRAQISAAQADHRRIVDALDRREGARAEALLREHGYISAENKRRNLETMRERPADPVPGLALIDLPEVDI